MAKDFSIALLASVQEGFRNVLHQARGHVMVKSFDECTCDDDAENAVVGMTLKAMEREGVA